MSFIRTLSITLVLTSFLTGISQADSNTTASANILGYTKKSLPANGLIMVSNPFVNSDKNDMTINEIFGTSLPDGTTLYIYDNGYSSYSYIDGIGWVDDYFGDAGSVVITRGQGLWIKNYVASPVTVLLSGNVPDRESQAVTNSLPQGIAMIASAYPAKRSITSLGLNPADGDTIYLYDNGYSSYSYIDGIGWVDDFFAAADDFEFTVGCGFWYLTSTSRQWVEQKPYSDL